MSRLVNYGPGDICDRLSILTLKIQAGLEEGRDVTHFTSEHAVLLTKLQTNSAWTGAAMGAALGLAVVNAALWHAEDDLREWRQRWTNTGPDSSGLSGGPGSGYIAATAEAVARVAFRIQALNDRRAALITEINAQTGHQLGSEK